MTASASMPQDIRKAVKQSWGYGTMRGVAGKLDDLRCTIRNLASAPDWFNDKSFHFSDEAISKIESDFNLSQPVYS